jgi:hypothetical protein
MYMYACLLLSVLGLEANEGSGCKWMEWQASLARSLGLGLGLVTPSNRHLPQQPSTNLTTSIMAGNDS